MVIPPQTLLQEYYSSCPVLEEIAPVTNAANIGNVEDDARLNLPLQHSFSIEHLKLIFEMRSDMADQLHPRKILHRRLDMFFVALSKEPEKRRCPTCGQPFTFSPTPHSSMANAANLGASGV